MTRRLAVSLVALASICCTGTETDTENHDPLEPPELPTSFTASQSDEELTREHDLDAIWTTTHPDYEGEIRILISSTPVEGLSPNYHGAFYENREDAFHRIDMGFAFGGFHPPELGRHPTLDIPAIVAVSEAIPERTYFFVREGVGQILQENEDTWTPVR